MHEHIWLYGLNEYYNTWKKYILYLKCKNKDDDDDDEEIIYWYRWTRATTIQPMKLYLHNYILDWFSIWIYLFEKKKKKKRKEEMMMKKTVN